MKLINLFIFFFIISIALKANVTIGIELKSGDNSVIEISYIPDRNYNSIPFNKWNGHSFTLKWPEIFGENLIGNVNNLTGVWNFLKDGVGNAELLNGFYYLTFIEGSFGSTYNMNSGIKYKIAEINIVTNSFRNRNIIQIREDMIQLTEDQGVSDNSVSNGALGDQFAGFTTGESSINISLPITLSSFTAEKSGDRNALLNWTSSQEINASHFTVQRSGDGYEFEDIGRIEAAGNSSSQIDYQFLDRNINIQRNTSKLIYYRLKQVDIDGFTEFSEIRALRFDRIGLAEVSIYPNPTADILHLDISEDILDDQINYEIFDVQGKMVVNQQINIDHQKLHLLNLRASGLQSGIYFIKLRNQKELLSSHKFVLISQ